MLLKTMDPASNLVVTHSYSVCLLNIDQDCLCELFFVHQWINLDHQYILNASIFWDRSKVKVEEHWWTHNVYSAKARLERFSILLLQIGVKWTPLIW